MLKLFPLCTHLFLISFTTLIFLTRVHICIVVANNVYSYKGPIEVIESGGDKIESSSNSDVLYRQDFADALRANIEYLHACLDEIEEEEKGGDALISEIVGKSEIPKDGMGIVL